MSAFTYRTGTSYPVTAQAAGEHLEKLEMENGTITAAMVVDDSRPPEALLHPVFEWDDAIAGEKWRRHEARTLIGNIVKGQVLPCEKSTRQVEIRAFSNIKAPYEEGHYKTTTVALVEPEESEIILKNARREMEAFVNKYAALVDVKALLEETMEDQKRKAV